MLKQSPYESFVDHLVNIKNKLNKNKEILRSEIEKFDYEAIDKQFRADYVK